MAVLYYEKANTLFNKEMRMKAVLNESSILHRMTREEAVNVKGGGVVPTLPSSLCSTPPVGSQCFKPVDSQCVKPTLPSVCDCLLAGCGCIPSQRDCHECLASPDPGEM